MSKKGVQLDNPWATLLEELRQERNESYRQASIAAGLDHGALHRFIKTDRRPNRESCIALAHHFDINPNELLVAAGYEPLPWFDPSLTDAHDYPFEIKQVAEDLLRIRDLALRRRVCGAMQALAEAVTRPAPADNG